MLHARGFLLFILTSFLAAGASAAPRSLTGVDMLRRTADGLKILHTVNYPLDPAR